MEFLLTASITFAATLLALGGLEVAAENTAIWNADHVSDYFWSIEADPNGSEAERLAYDILAQPMDWSESELCQVVDQNSVAQSPAVVK